MNTAHTLPSANHCAAFALSERISVTSSSTPAPLRYSQHIAASTKGGNSFRFEACPKCSGEPANVSTPTTRKPLFAAFASRAMCARLLPQNTPTSTSVAPSGALAIAASQNAA